MRLKGINERIFNSEKFQNILYNLDCEQKINVCGLVSSSKSAIIYGIYKKTNKNIFVITSSNFEAKNMYEDLKFYTDECIYFQGKENVFYNIEAFSSDLKWDRIKALKEICNGSKKIICTSVDSLVSLYMNKETTKLLEVNLHINEDYGFNKFLENVHNLGYEKVYKVEQKGEYAVRGGIIDIFPINSEFPYRIEFFGDSVDVIRSFNVVTQISIDNKETVRLIQAKEFILKDNERNILYKNLEEDFYKYIESINDLDIKNKLEEKFKFILERIKEFPFFDEYNVIIPYLQEYFCDFFDFMDDSIVVVDEFKKCIETLDILYERFQENFQMLILRGEVLPCQIKLILDKGILYKKINEVYDLKFSLFNESNSNSIVEFETKDTVKMDGKINVILNEIKEKLSKNYSVVILSSTKMRGEKLKELLEEYDIKAYYDENLNKFNFGEVIISKGSLNDGYDFLDLKLYVISDKEVFGESKNKKNKVSFASVKKGFSKIKSFSELKPGDYIVHVNHGIGVYKGIKQIEVQGINRDYLDIEYEKNDKLYVPIEQLDLVQKYIGIDGKSPKVNKLGGSEWAKIKIKTKKSVNEIAENLVRLYAERNILNGYAFSKDSEWQHQFEDEFPYNETPDQISAIYDIKKDMESNKPMDRLLCGDVGYGKTEVALRAVFKAVVDKKQVAFLVPTTILADQHYNNIKRRFIDFSFNVDVLSRFRTPKQQKETLLKLKSGEVDIIVGTHRLLSKDVEFKDLGLLIIDEEQRFGVKHKEKIKELRKNIDVLSLSATPIPRTLHMSMIGVRDISVIDTPPEERYPVQTYVVEYSDQLIRDAIIREISRFGQGFFVYNSVETIDKMNIYLQNLVPECRFSVIHGQMSEREIEDIVMKFLDKEIDFLVCTTIIETGIDIENANTIIIYNSDKFGLSQLYQLRGRVGRSNKVAYAYLTYKKDKVLTEVAEKRLKTLKDFTELGSGFKVAMKDLEIRGSGNIVGEAQHGQMSVVGYDLYCKMLEDAIKLLKGDISKEEVNTVVDIKIDAYIKSQYIEDEMQKIEIYKKISCIEDKKDIKYIREELIDRFSDIPKEVECLIKISYIRALGRKLGFSQIKEVGENVIFEYENKDYVDNGSFDYILNNYSENIVFNSGDKPSFSYKIIGEEKNYLLDKFIILLENLIKESSILKFNKS